MYAKYIIRHEITYGPPAVLKDWCRRSVTPASDDWDAETAPRRCCPLPRTTLRCQEAVAAAEAAVAGAAAAVEEEAPSGRPVWRLPWAGAGAAGRRPALVVSVWAAGAPAAGRRPGRVWAAAAWADRWRRWRRRREQRDAAAGSCHGSSCCRQQTLKIKTNNDQLVTQIADKHRRS